jgi:sialate O-acetylesterase
VFFRAALLLAAAFAAAPSPAPAQDEWKPVLDLRGQWKFELGDDPRRAAADFDDRSWGDIFVPAAWEDEGFPGYDGYAWYRKRFTFPKQKQGTYLYLHLGYVDDVSEVYVNGRMLGFSGTFPPRLMTAYNLYQQYPVPAEWLNPRGENVIAVRVYDAQLSGGMLHGRVGFFEPADRPAPVLSLEGMWRFATGDGMERKDPGYDDSRWKEIVVPGFWETQGFAGFDGRAWYRKKFRAPGSLKGTRLVLVAGKIDDLDEVYLNGTRIGRTGRITDRGTPEIRGDEYVTLRAYSVPEEAIRWDGENVLAVRVYDGLAQGGIYDGPVGFLTKEAYQRWNDRQPKEKKKDWDILDLIFDR